MRVKWSDKTIGLTGDLTNYDGEGLFRIELVEDDKNDEDNGDDKNDEIKMNNTELKFDYINTPEEIANILFNYIGYIKSENTESLKNVEYGLYNILCNAENPYNHDCFRELYSILDEFAEVYKERKFDR